MNDVNSCVICMPQTLQLPRNSRERWCWILNLLNWLHIKPTSHWKSFPKRAKRQLSLEETNHMNSIKCTVCIITPNVFRLMIAQLNRLLLNLCFQCWLCGICIQHNKWAYGLQGFQTETALDQVIMMISTVIKQTFTYPLTAGVIGAPQMTSQPVSSTFLCSPLPSHGCSSPPL